MPKALLFSVVLLFVAVQNAQANFLHETRRVGKKLCSAGHTHFGSTAWTGYSSKKEARRVAIENYEGFTAMEYGSRWASFAHAIGKTQRCDFGDNGWECSVSALPCRKLR